MLLASGCWRTGEVLACLKIKLSALESKPQRSHSRSRREWLSKEMATQSAKINRKAGGSTGSKHFQDPWDFRIYNQNISHVTNSKARSIRREVHGNSRNLCTRPTHLSVRKGYRVRPSEHSTTVSWFYRLITSVRPKCSSRYYSTS